MPRKWPAIHRCAGDANQHVFENSEGGAKNGHLEAGGCGLIPDQSIGYRQRPRIAGATDRDAQVEPFESAAILDGGKQARIDYLKHPARSARRRRA